MNASLVCSKNQTRYIVLQNPLAVVLAVLKMRIILNAAAELHNKDLQLVGFLKKVEYVLKSFTIVESKNYEEIKMLQYLVNLVTVSWQEDCFSLVKIWLQNVYQNNVTWLFHYKAGLLHRSLHYFEMGHVENTSGSGYALVHLEMDENILQNFTLEVVLVWKRSRFSLSINNMDYTRNNRAFMMTCAGINCYEVRRCLLRIEQYASWSLIKVQIRNY